MEKSKRRILLEDEIYQAQDESTGIVMKFIQDEFNGDLAEAMASEGFAKKAKELTAEQWKAYNKGYKKLERLELWERSPAMKAYAAVLDEIGSHLNYYKKQLCHYPFAGTDFYWARIFEKVVFEDIGYGEKEHPNMWWEPKAYRAGKRRSIIRTLKRKKIIPKDADIQILPGDVHFNHNGNNFRDITSCLVVKGDHDLVHYLDKKFGKKHPSYGTVITADLKNSFEEIEKRLGDEGYEHIAHINGPDMIAPFAMPMQDIDIFRRWLYL